MADWREEVVAKTRENIERVGWGVQNVLAGPNPAFAYTVGLSETFRHPEIFMVGFAAEMMHRLLNDAAAHVREGLSFAGPCLFDRVVEGYDVAFRPLVTANAVAVGKVAAAVLGPFEAVQMFLPDAKGKFPWDRGCDPEYAATQTDLLVARGPLPTSRRVTPVAH